MSRQCPKCKRSLSPGAGFCTHCGARIARESERGRAPGRGLGGKVVIPALLVLVGIAMVAAAALWWQSDQPEQPVTQAPAAPLATQVIPTTERSLPYSDVPRISAAEAGGRLGEPGVIFLDTRSAGVYTQSHIAGAILIEPAEMGERFQELPRDAEIITYCT